MKLKKIAALALAGVMAVSMLAGCAGKGTGDKSETTELTATVIDSLKDAIGKKDFVTVGADANLQKNLDAVAAAYGMTVTASNAETEMMKLDSKLSTTPLAVATSDYKASTAEATVFNVLVGSSSKSETAYAAVQNLVTRIMNAGNNNSDATIYGISAGLQYIVDKADTSKTDYSTGYTARQLGESTATTYDLKYNYKVNVAAAKVENSLTGGSQYVVAYTVTRTATPVARPEK